MLLGIAGTHGSVRGSGPWFERGYIVVDREVSCDKGGQETKDEQALQW